MLNVNHVCHILQNVYISLGLCKNTAEKPPLEEVFDQALMLFLLRGESETSSAR